MSQFEKGRSASLLGTAAMVGFDNRKYPDLGYVDALRVCMKIELEALGLTTEEIDTAEIHAVYPDDDRIESLIRDFRPSQESWASARPLCLRAYQQRLLILALIWAYENPASGKEFEDISPMGWMNIGAEICWYAFAADLEYMDDLSKSAFGAIGGKARKGKIFSPAKRAIRFAIESGHDSPPEIVSYFEREPTMDDIDIEVHYEPGETDTFAFFNLATGYESKPMKRTTLASAISQVRAILKDA